MGVGIAYVFAVAGFETYVVEPASAQIAIARATIERAAEDGVRRGKLDSAGVAASTERLHFVVATDTLPRGLDLIIESVPERFELKQAVIAEIERLSPKAIATNTSALSISKLAESVSRPDTFIGMHFFNPVWSLALVELVRGICTNDETVAHCQDLVERIDKQSIVVHDSPGFATSRLDLVASIEAMRMVQDGVASAADIDRAMVVAYRHPTGPLRLSDIVGLDVRLDIARNLAHELGERFAPPRILEELVAAGHLGVKSGRGFFDWSEPPING